MAETARPHPQCTGKSAHSVRSRNCCPRKSAATKSWRRKTRRFRSPRSDRQRRSRRSASAPCQGAPPPRDLRGPDAPHAGESAGAGEASGRWEGLSRSFQRC
eukprot:scaffold876_cov243-Pinguiococcus_pyrenoidosus.AAC.45